MQDEVRKRYETDEIFRKKVDKVAKEWRSLRGNRSSLESYVEVVLRNYEVSKSIISGTSFALTDILSMLMAADTLDDDTVDKISTPTRKRDGTTYTQMEMEEFLKRGQELANTWYTFVKGVQATAEKERSERSYLSGDLKTMLDVARWQYPDKIQPDIEKRDDSGFWRSLFRTLPSSHELSRMINQKIPLGILCSEATDRPDASEIPEHIKEPVHIGF